MVILYVKCTYFQAGPKSPDLDEPGIFSHFVADMNPLRPQKESVSANAVFSGQTQSQAHAATTLPPYFSQCRDAARPGRRRFCLEWLPCPCTKWFLCRREGWPSDFLLECFWSDFSSIILSPSMMNLMYLELPSLFLIGRGTLTFGMQALVWYYLR